MADWTDSENAMTALYNSVGAHPGRFERGDELPEVKSFERRRSTGLDLSGWEYTPFAEPLGTDSLGREDKDWRPDLREFAQRPTPEQQAVIDRDRKVLERAREQALKGPNRPSWPGASIASIVVYFVVVCGCLVGFGLGAHNTEKAQTRAERAAYVACVRAYENRQALNRVYLRANKDRGQRTYPVLDLPDCSR